MTAFTDTAFNNVCAHQRTLYVVVAWWCDGSRVYVKFHKHRDARNYVRTHRKVGYVRPLYILHLKPKKMSHLS